jgi:hypothetical protein
MGGRFFDEFLFVAGRLGGRPGDDEGEDSEHGKSLGHRSLHSFADA